MSVLYKWVFKSQSSPDKQYEVLHVFIGQGPDQAGQPKTFPELSCNCPGWTRRNVAGVRMCVHTRLVLSGYPEKDALFIASYNFAKESGAKYCPFCNFDHYGNFQACREKVRIQGGKQFVSVYPDKPFPTGPLKKQPEPITTRSKRKFNFDDE